jgi:cystathionine gamma-synthase
VANDKNGRGFESAAVHGGEIPALTSRPAVSAIYHSSTFIVDSVDEHDADYNYGRNGNPNRTALGTCIAELEGGGQGFAFSSGMGAEDTLIRTVCAPGDHVLVSAHLYGGTFRLFDQILRRWDIQFSPVDLSDLDAVRSAMRKKTVAIWAESMTNPTLRVADLSKLAEIAHDSGALFVVDNTFASPYLVQPLDLGADAVVHSTTKYLGGHSDVVGGAAVVRDESLAVSLALHQKSMGNVAGAIDAWLTLRGVRTLPVRMERHCDNAEAVARLLAEHPAVSAVHYPGLPSHPDHQVAKRQMRRFGGMVSFELNGDQDAAVRFCESTSMFALAVSLGGVESLVELPARMTHVGAVGSGFAAPPDLVRLSVGIETKDDLLADVAAALIAV